MTSPADPLLTAAQVAERKGVHPRTVTRWVQAGKLRSVQKLSGQTGAYVFSQADVDALEEPDDGDWLDEDTLAALSTPSAKQVEDAAEKRARECDAGPCVDCLGPNS